DATNANELARSLVDNRMRSERIVVRMTCMAQARPRYSKEEFARRGDEIYTRDIQWALPTNARGQFVAIDIETGAFEIDSDEQKASDRLATRVPGAQIWLRRGESSIARPVCCWTPGKPKHAPAALPTHARECNVPNYATPRGETRLYP